MEKRKKISLIIILLIVAIGVLLYYLIINNRKIVINNVDINYDKQIEVCLDDNNCELLPSDNYSILSIDTNSNKLKQIVNNFNDDINELYDKVISSNLNSDECKNIKDNYKYRYTTNVYYYIYHDDKIVSIARELNVKDLCTNTFVNKDFDSKIYDIETSKELNNDTILNKYDYTEEVVLNNIINDIDNRNNISSDVINIDNIYKDNKLNYILYFDNDGTMLIHYIDNKTNNSYNAVLY